MKLELCQFSQHKIFPSRGKRFVRVDGKVFNFSNGKSEKSYFMRRNPRNTRWTILYRRKHKKGTQEEAAKKRTRRGNLKFNRAIQGATLESILQKRNQKPEVRKAQREQAIRAAKEKAASKKKATQKAAAKASGKAQVPKQKMAKAPTKGATSRGGQKR